MLFDKLKIRDVTFRTDRCFAHCQYRRNFCKIWGHHTSFLRNRLTAGPDGT